MQTQFREMSKSALIPGALAGLMGGLVFGLALHQLGTLPVIAQLIGSSSHIVGAIVHLLIAAIIGAGFGLLIWHQRSGLGETLFWGMTYGTLWWFLGPLTLMPLLLKGTLGWEITAVQIAYPSLLGHMLYGVTTALAFLLFRRDKMSEEPTGGALLRGVLSGLFSTWFLGSMLSAQKKLDALAQMMNNESSLVAWVALLMIGALAGLGFSLLYPRATDTAGAGLVRGTVYGFLWWILGALTILPLLGGTGLAWSLDEARESFAFLPGFLLFGALLALLYQGLDLFVKLLLSDEIGDHQDEGIGAVGLRALGRGALAGIIGGLVFTLVMIQVGFLPKVASIIGADSPLAGFFVHLVISILIGASYGILFRKQSQDIGAALGWGVSYGFFWWILGPLTLLPFLLGATPEWTVAVASTYLASLVGHLAYGAALGILFYVMETRYTPWWITQRRAQAKRVQRRREDALTAAPALWAFIVVMALTVPIVLGK